MTITRTATARYRGMGKDGQGWISTQSGVLKEQRYGFTSRFEDGPGTNPEELIAAAHAGCFTMALSFGLNRQGVTEGTLETTAKVELDKEGDSFRVTRSDLELSADVPGFDEEKLRAAAEDAKRNCPISKLLNAEMELTVRIGATAGA
jgi:osmotically inducible protein OsmC